MQTYRPFVSKTIRFDTTKALLVIGREGRGSDRFPSVEVVDAPIDCGELEVDCEMALRLGCGNVEGSVNVSPSGWVRYLGYARDEMEREVLREAEEYLD